MMETTTWEYARGGPQSRMGVLLDGHPIGFVRAIDRTRGLVKLIPSETNADPDRYPGVRAPRRNANGHAVYVNVRAPIEVTPDLPAACADPERWVFYDEGIGWVDRWGAPVDLPGQVEGVPQDG